MSAAAVLSTLAEGLRAQREARGLTLDQLAERAGLSKAYLSRLESAERQPSIATLLILSRELGVPTSVLLGEQQPEGRIAVHRAAERGRAVNGLTMVGVSGFAGSRALEAVRVHIDVDRVKPEVARHPGEEWLHVLSGVLRLEYDGEDVVLNAGESAHFDASVPHRLAALGGPADALLVTADVPYDVRRHHR